MEADKRIVVIPDSPWSEALQGLMRLLAAYYPGAAYGFDSGEMTEGSEGPR